MFAKEGVFKNFLRGLAKRHGYEILGGPRAYAAQMSLRGLLHQEQINLVLDVGANIGQFAGELRACGYAGRIVSFEPLSAAHACLKKRADLDPAWMIADRTAIGAAAGSVEIQVSRNSVSSSILGLLASHSEADPQSNYIGAETVPMNRLDDLYVPDPRDRILLKIDVQGYEGQVLTGAQNILARARSVMAEISLVPLYEGQILAQEMWQFLDGVGFDAWSLEPLFRNPETGRLLQLDGVFIRRAEGSRR